MLEKWTLASFGSLTSGGWSGWGNGFVKGKAALRARRERKRKLGKSKHPYRIKSLL